MIWYLCSCLALDEKRRDSRKIVNCECVNAKPEDWIPNAFSQNDSSLKIFREIFGPIMSNYLVKSLIITITLVLFSIGAYGVFQIEMNFELDWYVDQGSYQAKFYKTLRKIFPDYGERVEVYIGTIDSLQYTII